MPRYESSLIVVVGSSNTDLVLACDRLPLPGETRLGGQFERFHGGKGANQAVAAARAGGRVCLVGARGDDEFGRAAAAALRRDKVGIAHFSVRPGVPSGVALILLGGKSRENMIAVARSANDTLSARDVVAARPAFGKAGIVLAQLETPLAAVMKAARLAREAGAAFVLNPAPARPLPAALYPLVDTLTPNEHEAAMLTGESDPARSGAELLRRGCGRVVITLGAKGALLVDARGAWRFAPPKVKAVDTVGAGDCFTGWLAAGLAEKWPIETALGRALKAAALSVTRRGAQASFPFRHEII